MRWSKAFIPTFKENPKDAETPSHMLSLKAGLVRQLMSGVHSYLPSGWKVCLKIMDIIREEMNRIGAQELRCPSLSPVELWEKTGRTQDWGDELFTLQDRKKRRLCLAPTHEELITELVSKEIHSYKDLPQILYQFSTKFRDEPRPRGGVLRAREFIMKDSYSFDVDDKGLNRSYELHREAYKKIFTRCGLNYKIVNASSGVMGGSLGSEEFMVPSKYGEDSIMICNSCGYQANRVLAEMGEQNCEAGAAELKSSIEEVYTPVEGSVKKIAEFLNVKEDKLMKSLLYFEGETPVFILTRGDHEVSEEKLNRLGNFRIATNDEVKQITGVNAGYVSPVGLKVKVIAANSLQGRGNFVTGANKEMYHLKGVAPERDFAVTQWADIELANANDLCPCCGKPLSIESAIEVGHIFKLGTKYSAPLNAEYLTKEGVRKPIVMGSYGIGIERVMAVAIEVAADSKGIVWLSGEIAPYKIIIIPLNVNEENVRNTSESIYSQLLEALGEEVLIDDRDVSAGVKFKDAELIGIPLQIIIGDRSLKQGKVEIVSRDGKTSKLIDKDALSDIILSSNIGRRAGRLETSIIEELKCLS